MTGKRAVIGLVVVALALSGCTEKAEENLALIENPTPEQEMELLIDTIGSSVPSEVVAMAVRLLSRYDPAETIDPLSDLLGVTDDPVVLVAVIESLPQAADAHSERELEYLRSNHPDPEVQAAAQARLAEFKAFYQ